MLIIGDVAIKNINKDKDIKSIEIIYTAEQETYICNFLNLKKEQRISKFINKYKNKDNISVYLYNATEEQSLLNILNLSFANNFKFKIASPITLYKIFRCKTSFRYYDVLEWENNIQDLLFLENKYFNKYDKKGLNDQLINLRFESSFLMDTFKKIINIKPTDNIIHNIISDKKLMDLIKIIKIDDKPNYERLAIFDQNNIFRRGEWNRMSYNVKLNSIIEKAYCDSIINYIHPEFKEFKYIFMPPINYFKKALMDSYNNIDEIYYKHFIKDNYYDIIGNCKEEFFNKYKTAYQNGEIDL